MNTVVIWNDKEYKVPSWAKWLAVDSDGEVWVYGGHPVAGSVWWWSDGGGEQNPIYRGPKPKDFTKELYKLEES